MPDDASSVEWFGQEIVPGSRASLFANISESYAGKEISLPIMVWRGALPGPTVAITGAVHGDEINGTGTIRHIIREQPFDLNAGTLVLVPVVNIQGFERHSRYLPDRRDLNRAFPGMADGSLTSRMAASFFNQVIKRCDYCIDLHSAAIRRTNFPNVRADLTDDRLAEFARAFGSELIVSSVGPKGSLRATACKAGCPTIILEAGEVWKVESTYVEYAVHGIANCLKFLNMVEGKPKTPAYRVETDTTKWVRAKSGGFLEFHVAPGDIVDEGDAIATNTNLVGDEKGVVRAPREGIVLGMTTIPSVGPGDPVCHLAYSKSSTLRRAERAVNRLGDASLHERVRENLAHSIFVKDSERSD